MEMGSEAMNTIQIKLRFKEQAQGMAEFALALPLLLMLVLGVIEAGRLLFIYSATNTASREAVRYGSAAGDVGGYVAHYEDCDGIRNAAKRLGSLAGIQDDAISITYDHGPGTSAIASCNPTFSIDDPAISQVSLGDRVVVRVEADYQPIVPLVNFPPFKISTVARRVIVKDVAIEGTPKPPSTPTVILRRLDKSPEETETSESEGVGTVVLVAELNVATSSQVTVPFNVTGTAENGVDYTITSSPVVIPPGLPNARIEINIIDDAVDEYDETIVVTMEDPVNADKGEPFQHRLTIVDNDDPPSVYFSPASQNGDEDGGAMTVLAQLSAFSAKNITVPFGVSGTAVDGEDFTVSAGPLSFPAGSVETTILITVNDDIVDEDDETVVLTLLAPPLDPIDGLPNVILGSPNPHEATIVDNDTAVLSFTWESQEIEETSPSAPIQVQLSTPSSKDVTVRFHVDGSSTATEGGDDDDYDLMGSPIVIPKGDTTAEIDLTPKSDGLQEESESVVVVLDPPTNAELGTPNVHTAWITDTPLELPTIFFTKSNQSGSEDAGKMNVVVQLSHAWIQEVRASISVGGSASQGADYTISTTQVNIPAGGKNVTIALNIVNDIVNEFDETIILSLGSPVHAKVGSPSQHTATILDNDAMPSVYFQMANQSAGEDVGQMLVTVKLSAASGKPVDVPFSVTGTATQGAGADYTISASPVTTAAGSTSASIVITVNNDSVVGEGDESIVVSMGTPTNAVKGSPDVHTAQIVDDDQIPCPDLGPMTFNDFKMSLPVSHMMAGAEPAMITSLAANWNDVPTSQKLVSVSFGLAPIWSGNDNNPPTYLPSEGSWSGTSDSRLINPSSTKTLQFEFYSSLQTPYSSYSVTVSFDNGCVISRSGGG
jgi:hypothetical protein